MYRALACLAEEHTVWAVPLAGAVCWISCYVAFRLDRRVRGIRSSAWALAAGFSAGAGIWSAHFIGMLGYDPGIGISYDVSPTLVSLVSAIGAALVAFVLVRSERGRPALLGACAGLVLAMGIACAHFVGIAGVRLSGHFVWDPAYLSAAIVTGALLAVAALTTHARGSGTRACILSATALTGAIVGLHFLAMAAARAVPDLSPTSVQPSLSSGLIAGTVAALMLVILGFAALSLALDHMRAVNTALAQQEAILREKTILLDATLDSMDQGLIMLDAHGVVRVCNERALALLDLPPDMMRAQPTFEAVRQYQLARRDFMRSDDELRDWVIQGGLEATVHNYERERPNGIVLEIRTVPLADGGAVRTYTDITARKRAETRVSESEARLALALDAGSDGLWDCDLASGAVWSSDRWWESLGYAPGELEPHARTWRALIHPDDAALANRVLEDHLHGHTASYACEHRMLRKDGTWAWMLTRGRVVSRGADGTPLRFIGTQIDISARKAIEGQIAHMARHDVLTGLPNRMLFHESLAHRLSEVRRYGGSCAILYLDLDRFKAINDTLGHLAGDAVLRAVAERLQEGLPAEGMAARLGGDEFAVLLGGPCARDDVAALAERLIAAVQQPVAFGGQQINSGLSIGIALVPENGTSTEDVLKRADLALYSAKGEGRNRHRFFEPAMDTVTADRLNMERDLRRAIEEGELTLHYQPQVSTVTGKLAGFEALVRWHHPVRGVIGPASFIPLAEESGLIVPLGEWVLRAACREAARWSQDVKVGVNLSPRQFQQVDLPDRVLAILAETGLSPHRLELEVTETVIIDDMARAQSILRRLKAFGVGIAIDDFGTGYSSLATLQAFPFDMIKIDRSFVSRIEESEQAAAIVRAVIGLGRSLRMGVVAEGVETEAQKRFLIEERCDEVQGYLIGRPQPIEAFADSDYGRKASFTLADPVSTAA